MNILHWGLCFPPCLELCNNHKVVVFVKNMPYLRPAIKTRIVQGWQIQLLKSSYSAEKAFSWEKGQRKDLTFTRSCPQKDCSFLCSVGISGHVPVYTARLIEPVWDTGWCLGVCTCMLICHNATVGRAMGMTLSLHKTPTSDGRFGMGRFHQHTDTWRRADNSQLNKRPPMFFQDISFVKLCQRVGNIPFLENGSSGLGSEHTSVVCTAIFSPRVLKSGGEKGPWECSPSALTVDLLEDQRISR